MDFPYTTRPVKLNYNYKYKTFINVYVAEKDLYKFSVRSGKKPLKYHIALVDNELNIKNEYIFLHSILYSDVQAVAQISSNSAILMIDVPSTKKKTEKEYEFYKINFSKQSCKKIDSPFPNILYVNDFLTIDDGKSYYISGYHTDGRSGLFHYDCSTDDVTPILLDDSEKGSHVVNFCLVNE